MLGEYSVVLCFILILAMPLFLLANLPDILRHKKPDKKWLAVRIVLCLLLAAILFIISIPTLFLSAPEETEKKMIQNNLRLIENARDKVMTTSNYTDYASVKAASVEAHLDSGSLNRMRWPDGVELMETKQGKDPSPIPGGEVRTGSSLKPEVWERFLHNEYLTVQYDKEIFTTRRETEEVE